jgi:hypothetical protein
MKSSTKLGDLAIIPALKKALNDEDELVRSDV